MDQKVFKRTTGMIKGVSTHYCPGCLHGVIHRLVAEVLEELNVVDKAIGIWPVGCSVLGYNYFACDGVGAAHGRAPAVATGIKRCNPDKVVFTYQGDGDLAAIGLAEISSAAMRGENITVIYVNNAIYGMTGGQMSPNTLIGQKTTTSPFGRDEKLTGKPVKMCELLSQMPSSHYIERTHVYDVAGIVKTKNAIKKAFMNQINKKGFSMVEVLSTCVINWGMPPVSANQWGKENLMKYYQVGVYKDNGEVVKHD